MGKRGIMLADQFQTYTVGFKNTKTRKFRFPKPFLTAPAVQITMSDTGSAPAAKTKVTKDYVKIAFKARWVGDVDLLIIS